MDPVWLGIAAVLAVSLGGLIIAMRRGEPSFRRATQSSPIPELDVTHPLVRQLARELRVLDEMPIRSPADRTKWYAAAHDFSVKLHKDFSEIYDSLPHELEHYLSDADIRAEDPTYAERQKQELSVLFSVPS